MSKVKFRAHIGDIGGEYADRRQLLKGQFLAAVHGVINILCVKIFGQGAPKAIHHEPVQRITVEEKEFLLLLTIIKSCNQCRIRRPVNNPAVIGFACCYVKIQSGEFAEFLCQLLGGFLVAGIFNGVFFDVVGAENGIEDIGLSTLFCTGQCRFVRLVFKPNVLRIPEPHYHEFAAAVIKLHGNVAVTVAVQVGEVNALVHTPHIA